MTSWLVLTTGITLPIPVSPVSHPFGWQARIVSSLVFFEHYHHVDVADAMRDGLTYQCPQDSILPAGGVLRIFNGTVGMRVVPADLIG